MAALGILLLGAESLSLTIVIAAGAAAAMIVLRFIAPRDVGAAPVIVYGNFILNVIGSVTMLYAVAFYVVWKLTLAEQQADRERQRSDSLLRNILPPEIADRLKASPATTIADAFPQASVLFADMGGFPARSSDTPLEELVDFLNRVYSKLDRLVEQHDLEKTNRRATRIWWLVVSPSRYRTMPRR